MTTFQPDRQIPIYRSIFLNISLSIVLSIYLSKMSSYCCNVFSLLLQFWLCSLNLKTVQNYLPDRLKRVIKADRAMVLRHPVVSLSPFSGSQSNIMPLIQNNSTKISFYSQSLAIAVKEKNLTRGSRHYSYRFMRIFCVRICGRYHGLYVCIYLETLVWAFLLGKR